MLFTEVDKWQLSNNKKAFLEISCGNILFVTFLKIFLESTICSGMMGVVPLLMGL